MDAEIWKKLIQNVVQNLTEIEQEQSTGENIWT
jgi:hypothetical protein